MAIARTNIVACLAYPLRALRSPFTERGNGASVERTPQANTAALWSISISRHEPTSDRCDSAEALRRRCTDRSCVATRAVALLHRCFHIDFRIHYLRKWRLSDVASCGRTDLRRPDAPPPSLSGVAGRLCVAMQAATSAQPIPVIGWRCRYVHTIFNVTLSNLLFPQLGVGRP